MKGPAVLWYTILRLLLIAIPLAIMLSLHVNYAVSAFASTFIGLCLSYILLARLRHKVAGSLYERMHHPKPARSEDDDVEDAFVDSILADDGSEDDPEGHAQESAVGQGDDADQL